MSIKDEYSKKFIIETHRRQRIVCRVEYQEHHPFISSKNRYNTVEIVC